jgi:hypothetical protein
LGFEDDDGTRRILAEGDDLAMRAVNASTKPVPLPGGPA